jgi:hypothetical protein
MIASTIKREGPDSLEFLTMNPVFVIVLKGEILPFDDARTAFDGHANCPAAKIAAFGTDAQGCATMREVGRQLAAKALNRCELDVNPEPT